MTSIWLESVCRGIERALDLLAGAVQDCTDELWETPMWGVPAPQPDHPFLDSDWSPITDPAQRSALADRWVARRSTPWSVAWHALEGFDYDLNGEFGPWAPPPPFSGHPHWRDLPSLPTPWSRSEMLGYADYCRQQARRALEGMIDERAATPLPAAHRYRGQPHAWIITGLVGHTTEHASQIRQFITAAGITPKM
ncbi:MAG TPA: DinB family protein [Gemmatimonadales bacterium]|nr:DinB family protein [Gemmatimonadales bacterium]